MSVARSLCIEEFRAGVTACLSSWSALRAAAESGWGGTVSLQKADDLRDNIYRVMDFSSFPPRHYHDVQDLEENLADYMEEEYGVILEDSSDRQVAEVLWRMYETCFNGDATFARQVVASAGVALNLAQAYPVKVCTADGDDDDDDDDEEEHVSFDVVTSNDHQPDTMDVDVHDRTPTTIPQACMSNNVNLVALGEYASSSLFGPPKKAKNNFVSKPIRQLGEAPVEKVEMTTDEDGFAPVSNRRRNQKNVN